MLDFVDYLNWSNCDMDSKVIDFVESHKGHFILRGVVDDFLKENGYSYCDLSTFSKQKINELDVF